MIRRTLSLILWLFCAASAEAEEARWIWADGVEQADAWVALRKNFTLEALPRQAEARIAVDSKARVWVNGVLVASEAGLNRGPTPRDTWTDEIDLRPYLREGENSIAVLAWYWGRSGFYHRDSGRGGFYFDAPFLVSDGSWKARLHPAFQRSVRGKQPNFRHSAWNIRFDAAHDLPDWTVAAVDDWPDAVAGPAPPEGPWGALIPRPIPPWRVSELRPYVEISSQDHPNRPERKWIRARLPYNAQVSPFLKVRAGAGLTVDLRTDHYKGGGAPNLRAEYLTRGDGDQPVSQSFEVPFWLNGHEVIYDVPREIEIVRLAWRESGYDVDFVEGFQSDDAFLDRLLEKSRRTLYVNLRDTFMDCPDRERAAWWGDVTLLMEQGFYALDRRVDALGAKSIRELFAWQDDDGVLRAPLPAADDAAQELPLQMLAAVGRYGIWNYLLHTGDIALAAETLPRALRYLDLWKIGEDGLVVHREGDWDWADWGENIDVAVLENAWYALALEGLRDWARFVGDEETATGLEMRRASLATHFEDFWNGAAYRSTPSTSVVDNVETAPPDDRAAALAVLAFGAPPNRVDALRKVLVEQRHASPYMEKYVLEALFEIGAVDDALDRMRERYAEMVEDPRTTLWEHWQPKRHTSFNHAWSGGPLSLLPRELVGLEPTSPGWRTCRVAPRLGSLRRASVEIETVRGPVHARARRDQDDRLVLEIEHPCDALDVSLDGLQAQVGAGSWSLEPDAASSSLRVSKSVLPKP